MAQARRRRGVVLTVSGLERLRAARREKERRDHGAKRYTQDELEAMTGLGIRTLSRVFDGIEPVDRRTLERVFYSFDLVLGRADFEMRFDRDNSSSRTHLPAELTTFLGRDRDITQIGTTLSMSRLLTLTGPGGVGKTRIAIRIAREHSNKYRDGVWFFDLSPIAGTAPLTVVVASWLGLQDTPSSSGESSLFRHLADKSALLIMDNCEHVREAAAALCRELLERCASLKIVATSREPLQLPGESVYHVTPLDMPPQKGRTSVEQARQFDAIRFFEDRAAATSAGLELSESNLVDVMAICRRLDGIPLAIELACAQLRNYSISDVAEQLAVRLDHLASAQRGIPDRQKTLKGSLEWSYALLPAEERALIRAMSVFAGPSSLDAVTTVIRSLTLPVSNVQAALGQLASKSFVISVEGEFGERYRMLQATQEHIITLLSVAEMDALRHAHAQYFADFVRTGDSQKLASSQLRWHRRVELETDNLRSALRWTTEEAHDFVAGARLAIGMMRSWIDGGRWKEGRHWFETILRADQNLFDVRTRAYLIFGLGFLATLQRDAAAAEPALKRALAAFDACSDVDAFAEALSVMTLLRRFLRQTSSVEDFLAFRTFRDAVAADAADDTFESRLIGPADLERQGSKALLRIALRCFRDTGSRRGEATALQNLAVLAVENDRDAETGTRLAELAIEIARETRRERTLAGTYTLLSEIAALRNKYDDAVRWGEQGLALFREFGHRAFAVEVLCRLGAYAALSTDVKGAALFFRDALTSSIAFSDRWGVITSIEGFARVAAMRDEVRIAINLLGYSSALRDDWAGPDSPAFNERRDEFIRTMRDATDTASFDECWAAGRRWTRDDGLEEVARLLDACDIAPITDNAELSNELLHPGE